MISGESVSLERVMVDWKGVLREIRMLAIQLQPGRFYALYLLLLCLAAGYLIEKLEKFT